MALHKLKSETRQAIQERVDWIKFDALHVFGYVTPQHVTSRFNVVLARAEKDIKACQRKYPGSMKYDKTTKTYRSTLRKLYR